MQIRVIFMVCFLFLFTTHESWGNIALGGLTSLSLEVSDFDKETKKVGFSEQSIKQWVSEEFKKAELGYMVKLDSKEFPRFYISLTSIKGFGNNATSFRVQLRDWMSFPRKENTQLVVPVWEKGGLTTGSKKKVRQEVQTEIRKFTTEFIKEFKKENEI